MTTTEQEDRYDEFYGTGWQASPDPVVFGPPRYWPSRLQRLVAEHEEAVRLNELLQERTRRADLARGGVITVHADTRATVADQTAIYPTTVYYGISRRLRG